MRALPGFFAVLLGIALAVPGRNDGNAGANEVIALARAALGGEATLEAVRSLSASGTFRRPLPRVSGGLDLELLLPARLLPLVSTLDGGESYLAALLLRTPSREVRFSYLGEVEAPHGRSDMVAIAGPDGFAACLFLDQASHLPLMLTYAGSRPRFRAPTLTLFLSDYREVDGIRLPHSLSRATNGEVVEEWQIDRWRVNAPSPRATNLLPPFNDPGRVAFVSRSTGDGAGPTSGGPNGNTWGFIP